MTINDHLNLKQSGKATGTFYFKQFKVEDGRSTMKVGTDAVLLGTVVKVENTVNILEIGTGSGVIALILAQRSNALIDAIDIDKESAEQAGQNVSSSLWSERIDVVHCSIQEYTTLTSKKYDLIVSNPPFFSCSLKSPVKKRNLSRHDDELNYADLIACSLCLLAESGSLWVILPFIESAIFISLAEKEGLYVHFLMLIISKEGRKAHRCILEFKKSVTGKPEEKILVILDGNGKHTGDYKELTRELYIDF